MTGPRTRALVLTAGFGKRLRPLTHFVPKALLPVCGETVAGHTLRQLARLGCEAATLNLHHLADSIPAFFGRTCYGMPLSYSHEEEIRGTLGALYPVRDQLREADLVLLVNGDTLCRWPWRSLIRRHLRRGADATLLLHRRHPEAALGGGVGVDSRGAVVQLRDGEPRGEVARRHVFAGAHVLSPRLLEGLEDGESDIIADLYMPLLAASGRIESVVTARAWHDLGTPARYLAAVLGEARGQGLLRRLRRRRSWVSPLARVHESAAVDHSVVELGAEVEEGARLESSVLLPGSRVAAGSVIRNSVIGPGVRLPASANIEHRMINRTKIGHQPTPQESVMGELIYTPL